MLHDESGEYMVKRIDTVKEDIHQDTETVIKSAPTERLFTQRGVSHYTLLLPPSLPLTFGLNRAQCAELLGSPSSPQEPVTFCATEKKGITIRHPHHFPEALHRLSVR